MNVELLLQIALHCIIYTESNTSITFKLTYSFSVISYLKLCQNHIVTPSNQ